MNTVQDFENAPVGATARRPGSPVAVKVSYRPTTKGNWDDGLVKMTPETLVDYDYVLSTPAPTTAREALDLAWELAHEVKEGQTIPGGERTIGRYEDGDFFLDTSLTGRVVTGSEQSHLRTLNRLPDPEPDWLKAPAVKARVKGYPVLFTWVPVDGPRHHRWYSPVKGQGETYDWQDLCDVTPLYPEGEKE